MLRKLAILTLALVLSLVLGATAALAAPSTVMGTYTIADNGQGGWAGGPLYSDGSAGGGGGFSAGNGTMVFSFTATTWRWVAGSPPSIDVCYVVTASKGGPPAGSTFCLSDFGVTLPVTGTPVKFTDPEGDTTIARVHLNH